ncbi:MAG: Ig-like domain-containing protein [Fidelibacterota bacterium]|nr:MAG: Ig-like domain-containing protein [Candidatus Neomarinimicrobiota bacterium]
MIHRCLFVNKAELLKNIWWNTALIKENTIITHGRKTLPYPSQSPNFAPAMASTSRFIRRLSPFFLLLLVSTFILWQCAAEGRPTGGPLDIEGPRIVQVEPPSGTSNLESDQDIEITFNELVDPVSVPGSVVISPEVTFTTRVRGRRIIIRPVEDFQANRAYVITLQRGIRDYQRNSIPQSYQLVFSTGGNIPEGIIQGTVAEFNPQSPVEVGLFEHADTSDEDIQIHSVDLAADGTFSFAYLPNGAYRLVAVEGGLSDFPDAIHRRPYALPTTDSLIIQGDTTVVAMRLSPLLALPQIQSVEWRTPNYLALTFSMPFGEAPLPYNLYPTPDPTIYGFVLPPDMRGADSTVVDLGEGYTQLGESYRLEPLAIPTPQLVDTIPPAIRTTGGRMSLVHSPEGGRGQFREARGEVMFSEPIVLPQGLMANLTGKDTVDLPLQQENHLTVTLHVPEPERYQRVTIPGWMITDEAGNSLTDSVLTLNLVYQVPQATGQIRGTIGGLTGRVVVEARDVETGQRTAYTVTDSAGYLLDEVPPGFYSLFAHEQIGVDPVPYYSGRWQPYHQAARFSYYPDVVEVRARWEVDGIDINFKAGNSVFPPHDYIMRRE